MSSKKVLQKRKRVVMTIQEKVRACERYRRGESLHKLSQEMGAGLSTVYDWVKQEKELKEKLCEQGNGCKTKTMRAAQNEDMETDLLLWISEMHRSNLPISGPLVMEKAKALYDAAPGPSGERKPFGVSDGWLAKFKHRHGLQFDSMQGEVAEVDYEAAEKFKAKFVKIVAEYHPDQIFNADETGLFWKKLPHKTYLMKEEKRASAVRQSKDRITLMFCSNASGDFRCKPVLVYKSKCPRALKGVSIPLLPVVWMHNSKAWMTQVLLHKWYFSHFQNEVKLYLISRGLPPKGILFLDNAPGHPLNLQEFSESNPDFKVVYFPQNTTSTLQPMDQGVIAQFKCLYTRNLLRRMLHEGDTPDTIRTFWKNYNIRIAIQLISSCWKEIKNSTLNIMWRQLWPDVVQGFEGFPKIPTEELAQLARIHLFLLFPSVEPTSTFSSISFFLPVCRKSPTVTFLLSILFIASLKKCPQSHF
uniref:HTH CENPB-type domain-containing protein n=1 Tax=Eptatretus burgeri TaxID=7764 RepID=A0A8C4Q6N4_EPTBU